MLPVHSLSLNLFVFFFFLHHFPLFCSLFISLSSFFLFCFHISNLIVFIYFFSLFPFHFYVPCFILCLFIYLFLFFFYWWDHKDGILCAPERPPQYGGAILWVAIVYESPPASICWGSGTADNCHLSLWFAVWRTMARHSTWILISLPIFSPCFRFLFCSVRLCLLLFVRKRSVCVETFSVARM